MGRGKERHRRRRKTRAYILAWTCKTRKNFRMSTASTEVMTSTTASILKRTPSHHVNFGYYRLRSRRNTRHTRWYALVSAGQGWLRFLLNPVELTSCCACSYARDKFIYPAQYYSLGETVSADFVTKGNNRLAVLKLLLHEQFITVFEPIYIYAFFYSISK